MTLHKLSFQRRLNACGGGGTIGLDGALNVCGATGELAYPSQMFTGLFLRLRTALVPRIVAKITTIVPRV